MGWLQNQHLDVIYDGGLLVFAGNNVTLQKYCINSQNNPTIELVCNYICIR